MSQKPALVLSFYDQIAVILCSDEHVLSRVTNDFRYFQISENQKDQNYVAICIDALCEEPDYHSLPPLIAGVYSPRNISYSDGSITYIDYFGKALAVYDRSRRNIRVQCCEINLMHEIIFLTILSRIGENLELINLHRIHALGIEEQDPDAQKKSDGRSSGLKKAALFLMPSGGGKTTLGLRFLEEKIPVRIISEDSPLVDRDGNIRPFPLRIGTLEPPKNVNPVHMTYIQRMEFAPKYIISYEAFGDVVSKGPSSPAVIFLGNRRLDRQCIIRKASLRSSINGLLQHMVVGAGLFQGVEYLLQHSLWDLARSSGLIQSRARRALSLLQSTPFYSLELGRDHDRNFSEILRFLSNLGFDLTRRTAV